MWQAAIRHIGISLSRYIERPYQLNLWLIDKSSAPPVTRIIAGIALIPEKYRTFARHLLERCRPRQQPKQE